MVGKTERRSIAWAEPFLGQEEAQAVYDVVLSGWLSQGERVKEFEEQFARYVGVRHGVAFFNGTVALHGILKALDIGPGDEVIVPTFTFISTATSVIHAGATPVFADIDPQTFNISPAEVEAKLTASTKAIMPVHYAGQPADMKPILEIAHSHNIPVIEDAAEAHGADYLGKKAGSWSMAAMFSFTPTKNMTTGEGGMVTTDDEHLAERLRLIRNHGTVSPYHHILVGYNYRMTDLQGALGCVQLRKLPDFLAKKRANARYLSAKLEGIPGIMPPFQAPDRTHSYMLYSISVDQSVTGVSRDELQAQLLERGIQTRVCFPPVHLQPALRPFAPSWALPMAERVSSEVLSLPFHLNLSREDFDYIAASIQDIVQSL
ncbi:MAG: DegT/DnrJ/EryC1/StrS family aminotransferase [Chloroflexi bacterium]|nr:DegT/DnrJ/EryC1/StrS family aminotransferase [Chloroflexota bacterium]